MMPEGYFEEEISTQELVERAVIQTLEDPAWFFEEILHFDPLDWQVRAIHAVFDVRRYLAGQTTYVNHEGIPRITIRSCHGTGKTQLLGMIMHAWNFTTYGKVACTAPKQDQLLRRLMPRYRGTYVAAESWYSDMIKTLGREVIFNNDRDWGAVMETASDPDNLAGYHDKPQLFLIDEASARRLDPMFPVIEGALSTPGSVQVEIGNPTRTDGAFYNHHCHPAISKLFFKMHVTVKDAPGLISEDWAKSMAIQYGVDSPIYKIRVLGEFASFDEYVLVPLSLLEDCFDRELEPDGSHPKIRVSVDVADGGADGTVLTGAKHYLSFVHVLKQRDFNWEPAIAIVKAADAAIRMFEGLGGKKGGIDDFVIDANGVGAGTAGILISKGYNVIRHIGGSTKGAAPYRNIRTSNFMGLFKACHEGTLVIESDDVDNLEMMRAHVTSIKRASLDKNDDIQTKEKMKSDGLPSPDKADSLAMQFIDKPKTFIPSLAPEGVGKTTSSNEDYEVSL